MSFQITKCAQILSPSSSRPLTQPSPHKLCFTHMSILTFYNLLGAVFTPSSNPLQQGGEGFSSLPSAKQWGVRADTALQGRGWGGRSVARKAEQLRTPTA